MGEGNKDPGIVVINVPLRYDMTDRSTRFVRLLEFQVFNPDFILFLEVGYFMYCTKNNIMFLPRIIQKI